MAQSRLPITVRIICCAMRHMSPEVNKEVADVCWRFRHSGVVAFDLAGPEYGFPPHKHIEAFRTMREKSVGLTIHAGEAFGAKSVELALACNANRIGHGTRVVEDERVLQQVIDRRVPLEMCVSSNVQTKAITKLEDHPIKKLFDRGVICVPCTDNPTVSGVTLSGEYFMLQNQFGFNVEELVRMMDYGFRSAFVDETLKRRLRIEAITKTLEVLKANNIDISPIVANASYYTPLGISIPNKFAPTLKKQDATLELTKALRKADVDCRFIGAVPLATLYKFYQQLPEDKRTLADYEAFKKFFVNETDRTHTSAKALATSLLQTEENIRQGTHDLLEEAVNDNVSYIEISVCPSRHTQGGLTHEKVLDVINEEIAKASGITAKIIIQANAEKDSPLEFMKLAKLCVEYKDKNVVGFSTISAELNEATMPFFQETFDFLRQNFISVNMFAGEKDNRSIPIAIVRGNARRIAGAFRIAESCALLNEVTSNGINVIVSDTPRMSAAVDTCFAQRPVRSFFDLGVKVAFGSLYLAWSGKTRSEQLFELTEKNGFSAFDLIRIIANTYGSIFMHYDQVKMHQNGFWHHAISVLKEKGYDNTLTTTYFA